MGACCHSNTTETQSVSTESTTTEESPQKGEISAWLTFGFLAMAAGLVMTVTLAINLDGPTGIARQVVHSLLAVVTLIGLLFSGWPIVRGAFLRKISLELLFLIGLCGTFAASLYSTVTGVGHVYYEVVLVLLAIYHFGQLISKRQAARLKDLSSAIPGLRGKARVCTNGEFSEVAVSQVKKGERIIVRPGETAPIDGTIDIGNAYLEELAHTGEPFPVPKTKGDSILAGSRVLDGEIELIAATDGVKRELDRLYSAIGNTQKSSTENFAQKVLNVFVPLVVATSIITFFLWWLVFDDFSRAVFNALAVTIVACPCGLGLAIPLAARRGLFSIRLLGIQPLKDDFVERLASVNSVVFDKTGTLSNPDLRIRKLVKLPGAPPALESWLAAVQRRSTHPVARPFWKISEPAELIDLEVEFLPARGVKATYRVENTQHTLTIGNYLLRSELSGNEVTCCSRKQEERILDIYLDDKQIAKVSLEESARDSSIETLKNLHQCGLRIEVMTGDVDILSCFRKELDQVHTSLTTKDKGELIEKNSTQGQRILYVGDGLNDVDALQAAHVSIGLSSGGSIASNVADAVIDHDDLSVLSDAIQIARAIRTKLQRLLIFVLIYNMIGITLAASGILHPIVAALLMLASSATVLSRGTSKV